jgi:hypothetical protein
MLEQEFSDTPAEASSFLVKVHLGLLAFLHFGQSAARGRFSFVLDVYFTPLGAM